MSALQDRTLTPGSSFTDAFGFFLHDFLPAFALAAALMAAIWIACAVIALAGFAIGTWTVVAVRELVRACTRYIRRRRGAEYAQLVTIDADGACTKVVNLDRYRRRSQQRHSGRAQPGDRIQRRSDDDPA